MKPTESDPRAQVTKLDQEGRVRFMVEWFMDRYEDPVHSLPWDEGDYVWIVDERNAADELADMFGGVVDDTLIDRAVGEVEQEGWQWVRVADLAELDADDPEPDPDDAEPEDDPENEPGAYAGYQPGRVA
jgi:hypothetical protein